MIVKVWRRIVPIELLFSYLLAHFRKERIMGENCEGVFYVAVSPVHDKEKAKAHHEKARELELAIAAEQQHIMEHESGEGEHGDIEKAKAHHQKLHELEMELLEELEHQKAYREHKHGRKIVKFEVLKDFVEE